MFQSWCCCRESILRSEPYVQSVLVLVEVVSRETKEQLLVLKTRGAQVFVSFNLRSKRFIQLGLTLPCWA